MAVYQRVGVWYIDYYAGGMRHKEAVWLPCVALFSLTDSRCRGPQRSRIS